MLYYTIGQWRIFVAMALAGLCAGAWYGLMSRAARFLQAGRWLNAFFDALISLGMWACILAGLLLCNYGEMRLYALVAAAAGFALYRLTIARLLGAMLDILLRALGAAYHALASRKIILKIFR